MKILEIHGIVLLKIIKYILIKKYKQFYIIFKNYVDYIIKYIKAQTQHVFKVIKLIFAFIDNITIYTLMSNILDTYALDAEHIDLSFKELSKLPDLTRFTKLKTLYCNNNCLTELRNLPETLIELHCNNNCLTELINLPSTLHILNCNNNQLTKLRDLPNLLTILRCDSNQLTELNNLPTTLNKLRNLFNSNN